MELNQIASFSTCDPDGDADQQAAFRQSADLFTSPVTRAKLKLMARRICSAAPYAAIPAPAVGAAPPAAVPAPVADAAAAAAAAAAAPAAVAPAPVAQVQAAAPNLFSSSSSESDDSDSDGDGNAGDGGSSSKKAKTDRMPKDACAMVDEIASPVSLVHV